MTTIPSITSLPTPVPQTSDPVNFDPRADEFLAALPTMVTEENASITAMNTVAGEVSTNATSASTSAATATTKASQASTSATNAATSETNAAASATNAASSATAAAASAAAVGSAAGLPGLLFGLKLSTAGSSSTFGVAAGTACDDTGVINMKLATDYTKTTASWAVGSGNGALDIGSIANSTWYYPHLIERSGTGVKDILISLSPSVSSVVTISNANPGVVTWTDHGLQTNAPVKFTTTSALPTGLTAGTQYFVKTVLNNDTFSVSATQGGSAIATSSAGSGTHTAASHPVMPASYDYSRYLGSMLTDGSAHWVAFTQDGDEFLWGSAPQDFNTSGLSATPAVVAMKVPPGRKMLARLRGAAGSTSAGTGVLINSPDESLAAVNVSAGAVTVVCPGSGVGAGYSVDVRTDRSSRVRAVASASSTSLFGETYGWFDRRGRLG